MANGESVASSKSVSTAPEEETAALCVNRSIVFLPTHPSPARAAGEVAFQKGRGVGDGFCMASRRFRFQPRRQCVQLIPDEAVVIWSWAYLATRFRRAGA